MRCCFRRFVFKATRSILVKFPSSFFLRVQMGHPHGSSDTTTALKKFRFILCERPNFDEETICQLYFPHLSSVYGIKYLGGINEVQCCLEIHLHVLLSIIRRIVKIYIVVYFLDFKQVTIDKQAIINLSSYSSNNYESVVLNDSEVTFLGKGEYGTFCPFLSCVLLQNRRIMSSNFLVFHISGGILLTPAALLLSFFFCSASRSSSVSCPSLMSSRLLLIFLGGFRRISKQIPEIFFPLLKSFFLTSNIQFYFRVGFLPLTFFTISYANRDCLSSTKFLIF